MPPRTRSQTPMASTPDSPLAVPSPAGSGESRARSPSMVNRKEALDLAYVILPSSATEHFLSGETSALTSLAFLYWAVDLQDPVA